MMDLLPPAPEHRDETPAQGPPAFTLIELLVVIAIMAIVLAMTVAVGPGVIRSNAMSTGLSKVASAVSLARSEAVRARRPTLFVLAPTNSKDERAFKSYAIIQADSIHGTNYTNYLIRWQKLPEGVLFSPNGTATGSLFSSPASVPYPTGTNEPTNLPSIKFMPSGGLDEDAHSTVARIALQKGVRMTSNSTPEFQGDYVTNEVVVQRLSGKVIIDRFGE